MVKPVDKMVLFTSSNDNASPQIINITHFMRFILARVWPPCVLLNILSCSDYYK